MQEVKEVDKLTKEHLIKTFEEAKQIINVFVWK